jgi:molybdopterin-guanine dinucleotide biosynthesis protein A
MFSFWSSKIFTELNEVLLKNNGYKIMKFAKEIGFDYINFKKNKKIEFFNVNDKNDYTELLSF